MNNRFRAFAFFLGLLVLLGAAGCSDGDGPGGFHPGELGLQVSPESQTIAVDKAFRFEVDNASSCNGAVSWKSENPSVASIDAENGRGKGIKAGTAIIRATCESDPISTVVATDQEIGGSIRSGTATLTVVALEPTITVSPNPAVIGLHDDYRVLTFTATVSNGPCDDGASPTWQSSDTRVATIDETSGEAMGLLEGETDIEASCLVAGVRVSGKAVLNVTGSPTVVISPKTATIDVSGTQNFSGEVINGDCDNGGSLSWSSSNPDIATVGNSGVATGVSPGKTTIRAACAVDGIAMGADAELTVTDEPVITVTPGTASIGLTESRRFVATVSNGPCDNNTFPTWISSNEGVATIDETTGEATGVMAGVTTITAGCLVNGEIVSGAAELTVTGTPGITVETLSPRIGVGERSTFEATVSNGPCDGEGNDAYPAWASSSPGVATIAADAGTTLAQATGVMAGTTTITASCVIDGALISGTAELTVATLTLSPANFTAPSLNTDASAVTLQYSHDGGPSVTWSSSTPSVATVDASTGLVTIVSAGTTEIAAFENGTFVSGVTGLTVIDGELSQIALTPDGAGLAVNVTEGATQAFTATGTFVGTATTTADLTSGCNWTSSDATVARIDQSGIVTGEAEGGPVEIKCTYPLDQNPPEGTQNVTVVAP